MFSCSLISGFVNDKVYQNIQNSRTIQINKFKTAKNEISYKCDVCVCFDSGEVRIAAHMR